MRRSDWKRRPKAERWRRKKRRALWWRGVADGACRTVVKKLRGSGAENRDAEPLAALPNRKRAVLMRASRGFIA